MTTKQALGSARLNRSSLSEQAAAALRKLILRNALKPGSSVTEREVSEQLGTSRTPAREAIRTLVQEGLISVSDTGRLTIVDHDLDTVIHMVGVLSALEGLASELTATNASKGALQKISDYHNEMAELVTDDSDFKYFDVNMAFHRAIVAACGNPVLIQTHKLINDQLYQARFHSSRKQDRRDIAIMEHEAIVTALKARDGEAAHKAMVIHLTSLANNLRAYAASQNTAS